MKRTILTAAFLCLATQSATAQEYYCTQTYFSNSSFVSNEFAAAAMPKIFFFELDKARGRATTSVTGDDILKIKGNRATLPLPSVMQGSRFELGFRKLDSKKEITWGPVHSDGDYKKSAPARYACVLKK